MNLHTDPLSTPTETGANIDFIKKTFESLHQDAVIWKAERLWTGSMNPDQQASAMDDLVTMLLCINNETKRKGYFESIPDHVNPIIHTASKEKKDLSFILQAEKSKLNKLLSKNSDSNLLDPLKQRIVSLEGKMLLYPHNFPPKITPGELKKKVSERQKEQKDKEESARHKAKQLHEIETAADAGLPENFEGNKDDVWDALKYGIYEHEGVYYVRGTGGADKAISNFTLNILNHVLLSDDQASRLMSAKNVYGFETMLNINTDDFVSLGSFKKILARRGDFIFKGSDLDLCRLQEYLQRHEVTAKRVEVLGWNNKQKFWAWSNGLTVVKDDGKTEFLPVDQFGIVGFAGKQYFIPGCSIMYQDKEGMFVNEKKFIYVEPIENFGFDEWSRVMYGAYESKSIPAILFYIGSIFRDVIMAKVRRFPLLNLFGPPGAGKGEMYDSLMYMFGLKQDQIMLGGATTVVGFMRKFAQFKNAIVGLDEYKNNLLPKVIESLKNLYDGIGYERGKMSNDFATESTPVHCSTIISGQDMPTIEPALFMRCITLLFQEGKFTEKQRRDFQKLKNEYEHHGLSFITASLLIFRPVFEEKFKDVYTIVFKQTIKEVGNIEVDDRFIMNISILLTVMHITKEKLQFPFTYNEAKSWLIDNMLIQHGILSNTNEVSKFWAIVENLSYERKIDDHFLIKDGHLIIYIKAIHPFYQKEMIQRRDMNYLSVSTLEYYLKLDKTVFIKYDKMPLPSGSRPYCHHFKYSKLNIDLIRVPTLLGETSEDHNYRVNQAYKDAGVNNLDQPAAGGATNVLNTWTKECEELPFPVKK